MIKLEYRVKRILELLTIHSINCESVAVSMPLMNILLLMKQFKIFFFFLIFISDLVIKSLRLFRLSSKKAMEVHYVFFSE